MEPSSLYLITLFSVCPWLLELDDSVTFFEVFLTARDDAFFLVSAKRIFMIVGNVFLVGCTKKVKITNPLSKNLPGKCPHFLSYQTAQVQVCDKNNKSHARVCLHMCKLDKPNLKIRYASLIESNNLD